MHLKKKREQKKCEKQGLPKLVQEIEAKKYVPIIFLKIGSRIIASEKIFQDSLKLWQVDSMRSSKHVDLLISR